MMAEDDFKAFINERFSHLEKKFDDNMRDLKTDFRDQQQTLIKLQLMQSNLYQDFTNSQNSNRADHARYEKSIESLTEVVLKSDPIGTKKAVDQHDDKFNEVTGAVKSMKVLSMVIGALISLFVAVVGWLQYINLQD